MTASIVAEIRGLRMGYGSKTVLEGIDLEIPEGRTVAFMGPVRAGKSTLLKALSDRPSESDCWQEGRIQVEERGWLVEQGKPRGTRSLGELLALSGSSMDEKIFATWGPDLEEAAIRVLDQSSVPLGELPFEEARLSLMTHALASTSPLLLLDEPDADLSDRARTWVIDCLERLRGERTVVIATHHLGLARRASDLAFLFVDGQIIEGGPTDRIFEHPRLERTQYYVRMGG